MPDISTAAGARAGNRPRDDRPSGGLSDPTSLPLPVTAFLDVLPEQTEPDPPLAGFAAPPPLRIVSNRGDAS